VAWAIPYEQIFKQAAYGRGVPMWGGKSAQPATAAWPQKFPYTTDLAKAKALLDQSAHKGGFEVPLSFDLGEADWGEPAALLIQESLGKIGIKVTLDKVPATAAVMPRITRTARVLSAILALEAGALLFLAYLANPGFRAADTPAITWSLLVVTGAGWAVLAWPALSKPRTVTTEVAVDR
jgi:ABC-type transport system substrate-binding protein